ncbi:MAG: glycosyltransferase [Phycisphaerales bacterium]
MSTGDESRATDVGAVGGRGGGVFFCTFGSRGDIHPYVAVARALIARGVPATIGTGEEHRETITGAGVGFVALPPSRQEFEAGGISMEMVMHETQGGDHIFKGIVLPWLERSHAALLAAMRAKSYDMLVGHPLAFGAPIVAEQLRLPYVYTVLQPMILFSAYDPPVIPPLPWFEVFRPLRPWPYRFIFGLAKVVTWRWARPLRELRAKVGLPRDARHPILGGLVSERLNLAMFSPILGPPQRDWPPNTVATGACLFDDAAAATGSAELERFLEAGEAPVLFTLGSAAVDVAGAFYEHAVEACGRVGRRCVLLVGKQPVPRGCDGVRALAVGYAPYSRVMGRCAAVVHQCGAGTTAEAMRAGAPQVCVPFAHDQPDNAARLVRLGVAAKVKRKRVGVESLEGALRRVLDPGEGFVERARKVGAEARNEDGAARAAEAIVGVMAGTGARA